MQKTINSFLIKVNIRIILNISKRVKSDRMENVNSSPLVNTDPFPVRDLKYALPVKEKIKKMLLRYVQVQTRYKRDLVLLQYVVAQ